MLDVWEDYRVRVEVFTKSSDALVYFSLSFGRCHCNTLLRCIPLAWRNDFSVFYKVGRFAHVILMGFTTGMRMHVTL